MRREMEMRDAIEVLILYIKACHILKGRKRDPQHCMLALAGKDQANIESIEVHRNIVWVKFRGDNYRTRYQSTPTTRTLIAAYDKKVVQALHKMGALQIPEDGLRVVLRPPRPAVSLRKLRSKEMKEVRRKSLQARKLKPKRMYRNPDSMTLEGVRHSQGYQP